MSLFKKYIDYLKDNPNGYWFKRKLYGYGWTPARWQGWAVLFGYIVLIFLDFMRIDSASQSSNDTLAEFLPHMLLLTILFIFICYKKGETLRWQWGEKSNKRNNRDSNY